MQTHWVIRQVNPPRGVLFGLLFLFMLAVQACSDPVSSNERLLELETPLLVNQTAEGAAADKVEICHVPPGNPDNARTISVSANALAAHLAHGDTEGACEEIEGDEEEGGEEGGQEEGGEEEEGEQIEICHIPPGNPDNAHTISVSPSALAAHLAHGDIEGACEGDDEGGEGDEGGGGDAGEQIEICHIPPGNPDNAHTISVSPSALAAHLAHGDTEGACEGDDEGDEGEGGDEGEEGEGEQILICHIPPGNPDNAHTISVSSSALAAHLAHGDTEGECEETEGEGEGGDG